jgi:Rrf2 family protein
MHISARADYAMRALLTLAASETPRVKGEEIMSAQSLPRKFLEQILTELRRAGIVASQRGSDGGYCLARPANRITLADVMRAVDGPLAEVRGLRPEDTIYLGAAEHLQEVWVAVRASLRTVLESVTLADVVAGRLSTVIERLNSDPAAWISHHDGPAD